MDVFKQAINDNPTVKMIEIKLSQGAKPGKGGILPKDKNHRRNLPNSRHPQG